GQPGRRSPAWLGGRGRPVRPARHDDVGGRHHRRGVAAPGSGLEAGEEGGRQSGQGRGRRSVRVVANGTPTDLPEGATMSDLLTALGLGARWVVAERNGEAVPRREMPSIT